jgi:DedD protein
MPADQDSKGSDPIADHKRRARWRLVGALILLTAVALAAPVLLEEQARPLSQDLLIDMPSRASAPVPAPALPEMSKAQEPQKTEVAKVEPPKVEPPKAEPPKAEPPKAEPPKAEPPKAEPPKASAVKPEAAKSATVQKRDGFMVQVGAYASRDSAAKVKSRLEAGGHRVTIQTIKTTEGAERHRVRIGPFDTREQALEVRDRAKSQGYDAALVAAS